jgi:hypothetical protein
LNIEIGKNIRKKPNELAFFHIVTTKIFNATISTPMMVSSKTGIF